ncbi:MAG: helix-turn-helix domain-containing protein [Bacteroidia bacterium]
MENDVQKDGFAELLKRLDRLEDRLNEVLVAHKEMLSFDEARVYLHLSPSYLYKLTASRVIPYFKPGGKLVYFRRADLDEWLKRHLCSPIASLKAKAIDLLDRNTKRKANRQQEK